MSEFYRVDISDIKSNRQRLDFDENQIAEIAASILRNDGLLRPLILGMDGVNSYTVLDGDLEYFAAVRAREENPQAGATVNAFVISPKNQSEAQAQIEVIRNAEISNYLVIDDLTNPAPPPNWISNLGSRLDFISQELTGIKNKSDSMLTKLDKKPLIKADSLLDLLNSSDERAIKFDLIKKGLKDDKIDLFLKAKTKAVDNKFVNYRHILTLVKEVKGDSRNGIGESGLLNLIDKF